LDRRRLLWGLAVCAAGVILARGNQFLLDADSPLMTVTYLVGVFIGLVGLVIVGSSMARHYVTVVQCPHCFTENPADAEVCAKCHTCLKPTDQLSEGRDGEESDSTDSR
jgi:ribosomal protein L40E